MSQTYHILSLKHSPVMGLALWWRANDRGYTTHLDDAGVYTEEQVQQEAAYYNDGIDTLAIPEVDVVKKAMTVVDFNKVRPIRATV